MSVIFRIFGLCGLCLIALSNHANTIQDHAFAGITHPKLKVIDREFPDYLITGQFDRILEKSKDLQAWILESNLTRREKAQALNNISIYLARTGEFDEALLANGASVELLEGITPFHPDLYHVMMTKGYMLVYENAYPEAEDALRHAQHIAHRNQGVYAKEQMPALRLLTEVLANTGKRKDADQTQRFLLRVNEQLYGAGSEEMIPSLTEVGEYFAHRGRMMSPGQTRTTNVFMVGRNRSIEMGEPDADITYRSRVFREAEMAYERSIAIIEDKYGSTDLRLVEPLKGLSKTKFLEGYARTYAERPMEQMVAIVHQNPGSDVADKAKALVELADLYIKTEDGRAGETYKQAWQLLAGEEHEELRYELFGRPVRLLPEYNFRPALPRYPVDIEPNQQLFVNLAYDVTEEGRVSQTTIVDGNIPLRNQKAMRNAVRFMKFRPRMVDGELVTTEGLSLHQTFTVVKPEPVFETSVQVGP